MSDMNKGNFVAEMVADILVKNTELGTKGSALFFISEPEFPIELLKENAEQQF